MKLNNYVKWTGKTCAKLETESFDVIHMLFGISTEVGELIDPFKKKLAYNKLIDYINVKEEIGDLMFYIASLCRILNFDLEEIIETNIKKLETRYPDNFTEKDAQNRDLTKERKILES
jgi:NTP pyrophosphatase (non-canonical NTP hydrolase)